MPLTTNQRQAATIRVVSLINYRQLEAGAVCLLLGVLVYFIARPEGALFLPAVFNLSQYFPALFISLTGPLPVFFHVLGLSLLSAAVLAPGKHTTISICLSWAVINGLFELGQHPVMAAWLNVQRTTAYQDIWLLEHTLRYFHHGTFDPADLAAILLAAAIAYPIIRRTTQLRSGRS